jgi:hypothetical protein
VALSRGDREAAVAIMAGRMGFYAVRSPTRCRLEMSSRGDTGCGQLCCLLLRLHRNTGEAGCLELADILLLLRPPAACLQSGHTRDGGWAAQVPFEDVPDLVATRRVLLVKGQAYVQQDQVCRLHSHPHSRASAL